MPLHRNILPSLTVKLNPTTPDLQDGPSQLLHSNLLAPNAFTSKHQQHYYLIQKAAAVLHLPYSPKKIKVQQKLVIVTFQNWLSTKLPDQPDGIYWRRYQQAIPDRRESWYKSKDQGAPQGAFEAEKSDGYDTWKRKEWSHQTCFQLLNQFWLCIRSVSTQSAWPRWILLWN